MLNRDGITKATATTPKQILANVDIQASCGCIVDRSVGVTVGDRKIAKAGTPIKVDPANLQTPAEGITSHDDETNGIKQATAVLLHDVDVTDGDANGTALYIGVVNWSRLDTDVQALIKPGDNITGVFVIDFK